MAPWILRSQRPTSRSNAEASPPWNAATSSSSVGAMRSRYLRRTTIPAAESVNIPIVAANRLGDASFCIHPELAGVDVRVALGRREARVTEQLLDRAQVGAALQQVGGKAVSQRMGADAAGTRDLAAPAPLRCTGRIDRSIDPRACSRRERRFGDACSPGRLRSVQGRGRRLAERDHPLFSAFTQHSDHARVPCPRPPMSSPTSSPHRIPVA